MKSATQRARRALLVAFGIATTTFQLGWTGVAFADQFGGLLDSQSYSAVQQITYQNDGSDLEENVPDAPGTQQAESKISDQAEEISATLEERFAALDERFEDLEESIDDVAEVAGNPQIVKSGSSKSTMVVSGRVHVDGWGFDLPEEDRAAITAMNDGAEPQNRLGFRRVRFGVKGKVKDNMKYKIELELAGGRATEFRDVYLGWSDLPFLRTLLLGNQKRPYGLDHLNSSRYNVFLERPFVIEANNQDARRLGLASYGVSEDEAWNWRYGVYNQRNVQGLGNYTNDHLQLEITGRLANTIWYDGISGGRGYAHWAISGSHGDSDPDPDNNEARYRTRPEARSSNRWINTGRIANADYQDLVGVEGVVNVGAVQIVGEFQSVWVNRDAGLRTTNFNGGYVYVAYFLTGEHMPWDRKSGTLARPKPFQNFWLVDRCDGCREAGWGAWQVAARYSNANYNSQGIFGGHGESFTFGLNWYWNPNARMQFNYITGKITDRNVADAGDPIDLQTGNYNIFGTRFMIDF